MNRNALISIFFALLTIAIVLYFQRNTKENLDDFIRPTPQEDGKCYVNGVEGPIWWSQDKYCYQTCPLNTQTRDSKGRCYCNKGLPNENCHSQLVCQNDICVKPVQTTTTEAPTTTVGPTTTMAPTTTEAPTTVKPVTTTIPVSTVAPFNPQVSTTTTKYLEDEVDNSPFSLNNLGKGSLGNMNLSPVDGSPTSIQKTFGFLNGKPVESSSSTSSDMGMDIPKAFSPDQYDFSGLMNRTGDVDIDLIHNPTNVDLNVGYNNY